MSSSLSYRRKFIILKREYGSVSKGNIKGHCKIERRGPKVFLTVNIENGGIESIYNVALVTNKTQAPIINLGKLFTDEMGKGKGEYILTERELGGSEFKTTGILVMTDTDILLGGYIDKEDGSIESYIRNLEAKVEKMEEEEESHEEGLEEEVYLEESVEETPIEEVAVEEVTPAAVESVEVPMPVEEVTPLQETYLEEVTFEERQEEVEQVDDYYQDYQLEETTYTEAQEEVYEEVPQEVEIEDPIEAPIEASEFHNILDDFDDDSMEPDYKTLDYIKRLNQKNQTINYVLSILRFFPYAEPFKHNLRGYNWWLVDLDSENEYKSFLPYFAHVVGGNNKEYYDNSITTCTQLMNKYQHYLFGLYNEGEQVKYFLYGIPGSFTMDEHPYRGVNGFNTWYEGVNVPGYWIIYIDPMTGKAVDLPNPMIPIT